MPSLEERFIESKGKPVHHNGNTLVLLDRFPVADGALLKLTFEFVSSSWNQGVVLRTDGSLEVNSQTLTKGTVLWHHSAPREVAVRVRTKKRFIEVNNAWDTGDGCLQAWHNGAAMIVEELPNGRRYRCNDGHPDENLDDIVFRIERVEGKA